MNVNVTKFCYTSYLAAYMAGNGVEAVDRTISKIADDDDDVILSVIAASAVGVHDHKSGVPPRSMEELKAEVTRLTGIT